MIIVNNYLFRGCNDGIVCIFNVSGSNAEIIDYASVHQGIILDLVISPNDDFVATTGTDKNIRIHSLKEMIPFLEIGYYDSSEVYIFIKIIYIYIYI